MVYEVTIPQIPNTTRINVPYDIPTPLLDAGAIELYATKMCGWTKDSGITAIDSVAGFLRARLKDTYAQLIRDKAMSDAADKAEKDFNSMFPS